MGPEVVNDVVALGLAVPQMGKVDCTAHLRLNTEFVEGQSFVVDFNGPWDRYKRLKNVTDAFAKEASKASAHMTLSLGFPDGLDLYEDQFSMMKDILSTLDIGKILVSAEPKENGEHQ